MTHTHEIEEQIEQAGHANKRIALLIAVLALGLAFAETGSKSAQTAAINENVVVTNLWAFFQAKTIRAAALHTAIEQMELQLGAEKDAAGKEAKTKRIAEWQKTIDRYESEPQTREGRKELSERAQTAAMRRETAMARYHQFEMSSAAFQVAIVLASASIITGMIALIWIAGGLGAIGLGFMALALLAPHAVHVF